MLSDIGDEVTSKKFNISNMVDYSRLAIKDQDTIFSLGSSIPFGASNTYRG